MQEPLEINSHNKELLKWCVLFWREAGLLCKIIWGINKRVYDFPVGDRDVDNNQVWAAVHLDGSWRFVDVSGAFTEVTAPSVPAGCVLIEDSGEAKREWWTTL